MPIVKRIVTLLLMAALVVPTGASAWGGSGHRLIGDLAYENLGPRGKAMVDRLIALSPQQEGADLCPVTSLADASAWADCVRSKNLPNFAYMTELHYVNTPIHAPTPSGSFCPSGNCVTEAVRRAELVLGDPTAPDLVRLLALEQLAHFLEDLHQPLHAGDNGDRGGNDVQVTPRPDGRARNLHSLWDGDLVTAAAGPNREKLAEVRDLMRANALAWQGRTIEEWALESWQLSKDYAYPRLASPPAPGQSPANGGQVTEAYAAGAEPVVREQLAKAAVRLAEVINRAAMRAD